MKPLHNASATQAGFHFQDVAAIYFFISAIQDLDKVTPEGEEDFVLSFKDGSKSFYQAKEVQNAYSPISSKRFKETLRTLLDDLNNNEKVKEIGLVTNSYYPVCNTDLTSTFTPTYMKKLYASLSPKLQETIQEKLEDVDPNTDITKLTNFSITKLAYEGDDPDSKLYQLNKKAAEVLGRAKINDSHHRQIIDEWNSIFKEADEDPKKAISTREFTAHTEAIVLDYFNFNEFFNLFRINPSNQTYIQEQYSQYLRSLALDIPIHGHITMDFNEYQQNHLKDQYTNLLINFVNKEAIKERDELGLKKRSEDLDIAKLIIWIVVINNTILKHIEEAFGLED
ncbi:dsDNA nuclease domain-containing protein (plasmid) [Lacticaseibacillus paracasei]|uniref:dsDNA nuclease domain-containing protein n=1 Tax=Lacticaseibacillus paracasei TaxID=1597 RepID=UPI00209D2478|nr:dsDNA nuclease domain-containing protein [Lacticaseibacillus paracasei]UVH25166.1 dsDNA nuclease domain-containing protein [Lacticaseibacillus paracasei]